MPLNNTSSTLTTGCPYHCYMGSRPLLLSILLHRGGQMKFQTNLSKRIKPPWLHLESNNNLSMMDFCLIGCDLMRSMEHIVDLHCSTALVFITICPIYQRRLWAILPLILISFAMARSLAQLCRRFHDICWHLVALTHLAAATLVATRSYFDT